jgi:hypothetical protein
MPYSYKKIGDKYCVYKEGGAKVGCTAGNKESLKKYLAALHIHGENISEADVMDPKEKEATKAAIQKDIEAKKLALKNAEEKLKNLKEFSLAKYVKSILEAEGDNPFAGGDETEKDTEADAPADSGDAESEKDTEKKSSKQDDLDVSFNMAKVKKYNSYPVIDNTGTVVGVSKNGLAVKVGDNVILVNFEDLLD